MQKLRINEYDNIKIMIQDDTLLSISSLNIGDLYIITERDDCVSVGDVVSVYKVINKTERSIESSVEVFKIEK